MQRITSGQTIILYRSKVQYTVWEILTRLCFHTFLCTVIWDINNNDQIWIFIFSLSHKIYTHFNIAWHYVSLYLPIFLITDDIFICLHKLHFHYHRASDIRICRIELCLLKTRAIWQILEMLQKLQCSDTWNWKTGGKVLLMQPPLMSI